jgi:hypothetical protein
MYQQLKSTLVEESKNWIEHKIIKNTNPEEVAEYIIILHEGLIFHEGINKNKDEFKKISRNIIEKTISVLKA